MQKLKLEELNRLSIAEYQEASKHPVVVVLDNVRSMHNVGSVFRSSDAFRIEKLYLCGITPKPPHREIRKTAIGAEESVAWESHPDTLSLVQSLQSEGYQIACIEQTDNSIPLHTFQPADQPVAIILGHEVDGVSQSVAEVADVALEIPQFGTKHSLNVSVTAGIVLHHIVVQGFHMNENTI